MVVGKDVFLVARKIMVKGNSVISSGKVRNRFITR